MDAGGEGKMNAKIGDKFIVEIGDGFVDGDGKRYYRAKGFNTLFFDDLGLSKLEKLKQDETQSAEGSTTFGALDKVVADFFAAMATISRRRSE